MELRNPSNGETLGEPTNPKNVGKGFFNEFGSSCSTPYGSASSSPGRNPCGYFLSAPVSPMRCVTSGAFQDRNPDLLLSAGSFEFDGANTVESMTSADELFFNGQIRLINLSSHLQRPQNLAPLVDLKEDEEEATIEAEMNGRGRDSRLRSGSMRRRARSLSPMRNYQIENHQGTDLNSDPKDNETETVATSNSLSSSSSSRSSSSRWIFLKDFLKRSKSEGRDRTKEKERFWNSISFSPSKDKSSREKEKPKKSSAPSATPLKNTSNGVGKRKGWLPSAHERHYAANRAQAEEMRKRTFLPYRQGLLGGLGFSSKSYGASNGLARAPNSVSSK